MAGESLGNGAFVNEWSSWPMIENAGRILFGLLLAFLLNILVRFAIPIADQGIWWALTKDWAAFLFAFTVGGFVAQRKFLLPAFIYSTIWWFAIVVLFLVGATERIEPYNFSITTRNEIYFGAALSMTPGLLLYWTSSLLGAMFGMKLFDARARNAE